MSCKHCAGDRLDRDGRCFYCGAGEKRIMDRCDPRYNLYGMTMETTANISQLQMNQNAWGSQNAYQNQMQNHMAAMGMGGALGGYLANRMG